MFHCDLRRDTRAGGQRSSAPAVQAQCELLMMILWPFCFCIQICLQQFGPLASRSSAPTASSVTRELQLLLLTVCRPNTSKQGGNCVNKQPMARKPTWRPSSTETEVIDNRNSCQPGIRPKLAWAAPGQDNHFTHATFGHATLAAQR
jgi:hypothetical protein